MAHSTITIAPQICSNEPGYYEDGSFGVRIENLVVVKEMDTPNRWGPLRLLIPLTLHGRCACAEGVTHV